MLLTAALPAACPRCSSAAGTSGQVIYPCGQLNLDATLGFAGSVKESAWAPLFFEIDSRSCQELDGVLRVDVTNGYPARGGKTTTSYCFPITIPPYSHSHHQYNVYIDQSFYPLHISFSSSTGDILFSRQFNLHSLRTDEPLVLIASRNGTGLGFLRYAAPFGRAHLAYIDSPGQFPLSWLGYDAIDIVVVHDFVLGDLEPAQIEALRTWVDKGGSILLIANQTGINIQDEFVLNLVPGTLTGRIVPVEVSMALRNPHVQPAETGADCLGWELKPAGTAHVMLGSHEVPGLVHGRYGAGHVFFLSFDPGVIASDTSAAASRDILDRCAAHIGDLSLRDWSEVTRAAVNQQRARFDNRVWGKLEALNVNTPPRRNAIIFLSSFFFAAAACYLVALQIKPGYPGYIMFASVIFFSLLLAIVIYWVPGHRLRKDSIQVNIAVKNAASQTASFISYRWVQPRSNGCFAVADSGDLCIMPLPAASSSEYNSLFIRAQDTHQRLLYPVPARYRPLRLKLVGGQQLNIHLLPNEQVLVNNTAMTLNDVLFLTKQEIMYAGNLEPGGSLSAGGGIRIPGITSHTGSLKAEHELRHWLHVRSDNHPEEVPVLVKELFPGLAAGFRPVSGTSPAYYQPARHLASPAWGAMVAWVEPSEHRRENLTLDMVVVLLNH